MPSVKAYRHALEQLWPTFSLRWKKLLSVHYAARHRTISMGELAAAVGYKAYHSANLQYGLLAAQIGAKVGMPPHAGHLNIYAVGTWPAKHQRAAKTFRFTMRPELATALEQLRLVDAMPPLHVVQGGLQNGDEAYVRKYGRQGKGTADGWVVPKNAKVGDDVAIFFIGGPGILATAKIAGSPSPADDWPNRYRAPLSSIRLLTPSISLGVLRKRLPELQWLKYPRSLTTLDPVMAKKLRQLIAERRAGRLLELDDVDLPTINLEELRRLALLGAKLKLRAKKKTVAYRNASEAVRRYVLARAKGKCEACGDSSPFITADRQPYLEAHHLTRLADGGPDHPAHVIAVCANCHRKAHFSIDRASFNTGLKKKVSRLER
jgi:HNH endonuclease